MATTLVTLKYEGTKIASRESMDAYDVADAIDGFSDFLLSLSQANFGNDAQIKLSIHGLRNGSLEIQFYFELVAAAKNIMDALGGLDLAEAIKQAIELLKHLHGKPPNKTVSVSGGSVQVENNSGQIIVVNQPILNAVINGDLSQNSERFMRRPLRNEADDIQIEVDGKKTAEARKPDAESFVPIGNRESLAEFSSEQYLTIQTAVLEGDGQWRFSDGRNKFRAEIADKAFLARIKDGHERFGRGDILKVKLKSTQEKIRGQLRTTHVVDEVFDHEPYKGGGQGSFL